MEMLVGKLKLETALSCAVFSAKLQAGWQGTHSDSQDEEGWCHCNNCFCYKGSTESRKSLLCAQQPQRSFVISATGLFAQVFVHTAASRMGCREQLLWQGE